jgi:hypothetical protein
MMFRLDDLVDRFGLPLPNHIKLDVDGGELAVLDGASRTLASPTLRSVLVEVSSALSGAVTDVLDRHGLALEWRTSVRNKAGEYEVWYGLFGRAQSGSHARGRTADGTWSDSSRARSVLHAQHGVRAQLRVDAAACSPNADIRSTSSPHRIINSTRAISWVACAASVPASATARPAALDGEWSQVGFELRAGSTISAISSRNMPTRRSCGVRAEHKAPRS